MNPVPDPDVYSQNQWRNSSLAKSMNGRREEMANRIPNLDKRVKKKRDKALFLQKTPLKK